MVLAVIILLICIIRKSEKISIVKQKDMEYTVVPYMERCENACGEGVLYVATSKMPDSFYRALAEWVEASYGNRIVIEDPVTFFQPPIVGFCLQESTVDLKARVGLRFYVPDVYEGRILSFYVVESGDDGEIFIAKVKGFADELTNLASKTSPDNPLYYVNDTNSTYVLIGDEVIWIDGAETSVMRDVVSGVYTADQVVYTAQILLDCSSS